MRIFAGPLQIFEDLSLQIFKDPAKIFTKFQVNTNQAGVTKHRNGMERNGIYRNRPEYTGTRQNDAGMKRNGQEWYQNVPERAGMTPEYTEMRLESTRI